MKHNTLVIAAIVAVTALNSTSRANTYTDATGENFTTAGGGILDITSVEVTNTASDMVFKIKLGGNPVTTDWGKYLISIQVTNSGNMFDTSGDGWARPISVAASAGPVGGIDYWVGSWADGGNGAELYKYGGTWTRQSATYNPNPDGIGITKDTNSVTIKFNFSGLGVAFGDTIYFDVYTSGGGGSDSAVDALSRSDQTIADWGNAFASTNLSAYTLQTVTVVPHTVKFSVDMGVPIWDYNNPHSAPGGGGGVDGFNTNTPFNDLAYVRGSYNGNAGDQLFQDGNSTIYTNTVTFLATPNDVITYKFQGSSFPGYEQPLSTGGADRSLTLTNTSITLPVACFGDRCLSYPQVSTVKLAVDMSLAKNFGVFDPTTNGITMPGSFNGWGNGNPSSAFPLYPESAPNNTNVYTNTITFYYYPLGLSNVGFCKFYITNLVNTPRDNGWENPISTSGGNRSISLLSVAQTNSYYYNDEDPKFNLTSAQKLDADSAKISWNSYPARFAIHTGGVYRVESRTLLTGSWTSIGTNYSTTSSSSFTNTGLTGVPQQFYRVSLIDLNY